MFQRRSTNLGTTSSVGIIHHHASSIKASHGSTTVPRRKVRRRRSKELDDIRSLVFVAVLTCVITAVVVWLGSKLLMFGYQRRGHGSHHEHRVKGNNVPYEADDDFEPLPWNPIYRIPEAMDLVGDRSDEYARLRQKIDEILPPDGERSFERVRELTQSYAEIGTMPMGAHHSDQVREDYDIYNCPDTPPAGYPFEWKLVDEVLNHWPVTEIENVPAKVHQGLCVFDYQKDYDKAVTYRKAELPFVVVNDPNVARTAERWAIPGYLDEMLGKDVLHRAEYNTNSHFLYHQPTRKDRMRKRRNRRLKGDDQEEEMEQLRDFQGRVAGSQRTDTIPQAMRMTYDDWLQRANKTHVGTEEEHWYFRLIGCGYMDTEGNCDQGSSEYLFDELPYFQPRNDNRNEIYLGNPKEQKGIHCRFGMKGVIAENHFDAGRNSIAVLGGRRRYILSHPRQCVNLALLPRGHPSARHSEVDYANPDLERYTEFANDALGNEVVLEAGQVLYLPTFWFHYIVSLDLNFQCNTRSGNTNHYNSFIRDCGFPVGSKM
uniref:JmjC domain-containing protein n=2 Tax=Amphora coffeiformis TaxID=265554 RepID=A0A7S3PDC1_9STRA|mmetsp:Transcript_13781/g.26430  ORF Transcript_13781/g.26430 Transcript_13781/m.26430 type:complete len:543 (+) Transcript_13781:114-1742(+)